VPLRSVTFRARQESQALATTESAVTKAAFPLVLQVGLGEAASTCFVLVAGGLGERLGYGGIKLSLPVDLASERPYLGLYAESILALQARCGGECIIPLAIMTSDDTHERTVQLLETHGYFGLAEGQVRLLKQEKVAALVDARGSFVLEDDGQALVTKPHGHGDVHLLLHLSGLAAEWRAAGKRWVCFFQDTNGLVFKSMLAVLGVSRDRDLDLNSMCIPRMAKQEIGAITKLVFKDGRSITANTEYNQLGPLLVSLGQTEGDVPDATGFSPFPGNINQLVVKLESYAATLAETRGVMEEFVNPKYKDASRTAFKKPTRLECMMQDYAKVLPPTASVGFTTSEIWVGYSPAKNSIAEGLAKVASGVAAMSPATAEADMYAANANMWRLRGCSVAAPEHRVFGGIPVALGPLLSVSPHFAMTRVDFEAALPRPTDVKVAVGAALVVVGGGRVVFEGLDLDGALVIDTTACPGALVTVAGLVVRNRGWEVVPLTPEEEAAAETDEVLRIRGYCLVKHETHTIALPASQGPFAVSE